MVAVKSSDVAVSMVKTEPEVVMPIAKTELEVASI
jgi:hypothetical protein